MAYQLQEIQKLTREKEVLEMIINHTDLGILLVDSEGIVIWANDKYSQMTGFDITHYYGKHVDDISRQNDIIVENQTIFDQIKDAPRQVVTSEVHLMNNEDFIATTVTPLYFHGKVRCYFYSLNNVSNSVRLQAELTQASNRSKALERQLNEMLAESLISNDIIISDQRMIQLYKMATRIASVSASVMILGESGAGKDVYAKYIHSISDRQDNPFVHVNLGAIPKDLFESELFGYEPGAFTGASRSGKTGLIELANGGTLFLDEVGELDFNIQAKLLLVLQDRTLRKIGGSRNIPVDIRVIAATNKNLEEMVANNEFRLDLYYRLNVITVSLPPLRERKSEIPLLANKFLETYNRKYNMNKTIDARAMAALVAYDYPGNIRQLNHMIESAVVISNGDLIKTEDFPAFAGLVSEKEEDKTSFSVNSFNYKEAFTVFETSFIQRALEEYKTTTAAAQAMGIDVSTLSKKRKRYGI